MPIALASLSDNILEVTLTKRNLDATVDPITDATPTLAICASVGRIVEGLVAGTPPEVTTTAHGLATGDKVAIDQVLGMTGINGVHTVTVVDVDTFTLDGATGVGVFDPTVGLPAWYKVVDVVGIAHQNSGRYAAAYSANVKLSRDLSYTGFIYDTGLYAGDYWRKTKVSVK